MSRSGRVVAVVVALVAIASAAVAAILEGDPMRPVSRAAEDDRRERASGAERFTGDGPTRAPDGAANRSGGSGAAGGSGRPARASDRAGRADDGGAETTARASRRSGVASGERRLRRAESRLLRTLARRGTRSRAYGSPEAGRLIDGVRLPREGATFFSWDPVRRVTPNREWRRHGTDRLLRTTLRVLRDFARAHPAAPRIGVGDISRTRGGDFGRRFGPVGHASHQNGLDVDVYYPRRDERERAPVTPSQVDRALSQDLVDRFVRAGAQKVFVGPALALQGPPDVVQPLAGHDNHLHVRLRPAR